MNLDLLDGVDPLVQHMLSFEHLAEATLSNDTNLLEESLVPVLLKILAELVIVG
jgi:hypothetical protein